MAETSTKVAKQNLSGENRIVPRFAFLALLGGNAALATGPLFVRLADVGPVSAAFWRLALALPFLLIFAWRQGGGATDWRALRSLAPLVLLGGTFFAADLASWHLGIMQTKMAHATLFGNAASLILAVTTFILARRLPHVSEGGAVLLAVAGAVLLMRESGQEGEARLTGDLLCLLAGVLYAGYVLSLQRARNHLASWPTLALSTAAGVLPLLLAAWLMREAIVPTNWGPVIALAVTSQIVGQGLLIYALPFFSELVVGLTLLTQPAMAALIGWLVYRETLSPWELLGGVMVAVALVLVRLPRKNRSS
jgi:drug/metabolite transporter (DMT)-like permease